MQAPLRSLHRRGCCERRVDAAAAIVPEWWGITTVCVNGSVTFTCERKPRRNPAIDPTTLVRLLWRDEAMAALLDLGRRRPEVRASRSSLWDEILGHGHNVARLNSPRARRDPASEACSGPDSYPWFRAPRWRWSSWCVTNCR